MTPTLLPHRFPGPLLAGTLLDRPNRFLAIVRLQSGQVVEAHIGDRGRLEGILFPGAEVYLGLAPGVARRTAHTLLCARGPSLLGGAQPLLSIDPAGANRLVRALLDERALPLPAHLELQPEARRGDSRFDFRLSLRGGKELWLEVKSAAVAAGSAALFPDAPSERATRHCLELARICKGGGKAAIVMVAQRADVLEIRPHPVDPDFAEALAKARSAGVKLLGVAFEVTPEGFLYRGPRPVRVRPPRPS